MAGLGCRPTRLLVQIFQALLDEVSEVIKRRIEVGDRLRLVHSGESLLRLLSFVIGDGPAALKHLPRLQERPAKLQERIFTKLFEAAQIGKFNQEEMQKYEESLKVYWDIHAVVETAFDEGKIEEKLEVARKAIKKGLDNEFIVELTNLNIEEIEKLRNK